MKAMKLLAIAAVLAVGSARAAPTDGRHDDTTYSGVPSTFAGTAEVDRADDVVGEVAYPGPRVGYVKTPAPRSEHPVLADDTTYPTADPLREPAQAAEPRREALASCSCEKQAS